MNFPYAGPMAQGIGYDTYGRRPRVMPMAAVAPMIALPKPPPRFPTPGQMDGSRNYAPKWHGNMMGNPMHYGGR